MVLSVITSKGALDGLRVVLQYDVFLEKTLKKNGNQMRNVEL